ncbi:MAG: D-alanine--D-alanine ligase [Myxococcota bacterium]|jgi:D-alanine-D-alanine ligase|nr:D-alanine--D-alanine ligase [Myxococcota bacterium]
MKLRIGLLYGGRSVEHEVSISSARSIFQALDRDRYDISLVEIDYSGHWYLREPDAFSAKESEKGMEVSLAPVPGLAALVPTADPSQPAIALDVIFPIIHGRNGEDGTLQGLLELKEIPYVGSGVLSSAAQMDKDIAKKLLAQAALPVVPWLTFRRHELEGDRRQAAESEVGMQLGYPVFVKPANSGSSVGISKVKDRESLAAALDEALRHDDKLIVERGLDAREIEVAVLGDEVPEASVPGEIKPSHEFYDYEAKYLDNSTDLLIPAPLSDERSARLREMATEAFRALDAAGMARVDFLIDRASDEIYINELNSLPGFTDVSMYAQLWQATGLPMNELLDRLVDLALKRNQRRRGFQRRFSGDS